MQEFSDDDPGYTQWLAANPSGFVLNLPRTGAVPRVLHRATCYTINGIPSAGVTWTGGQYIKRCFSDEADLNAAGASGNGEFVGCRTCNPPLIATKDSTPTLAGVVSTNSKAQQPVQLPVGLSKPIVSNLPSGTPIITATKTPARIWRLWQRGNGLKTCTSITPLLTCWEKKNHPAQIKLQSYLDRVQDDFSAILYLRDDPISTSTCQWTWRNPSGCRTTTT